MPARMRELAQTKHILHIVQACLILHGVPGPEGGPEGSAGEGFTARGTVNQFQAVSGGCQKDGVITDNITAPHGMDANFAPGALSRHPDASVPGILLVIKAISLIEHLDKASGGAAGGILLEAVMNLNHLGVVIGA